MLCMPANGSGLKFLWIILLSGLEKAKEVSFQFGGSMSLFMKATIPGTHGRLKERDYIFWGISDQFFEAAGEVAIIVSNLKPNAHYEF